MSEAIKTETATEKDETFFYFAFGSNLLTKRIHIQNPSAKRYSSGILKNYRLDFFGHASRWNGATATIVEDEDEVVWGAIWKIDIAHIEHLDRQEGVHIGIYLPIHIPVITPDNKTIECRAYQLVNNPSDRTHFSKPSKTYLSVILAGAIESGLPEEYIRRVESIESNGHLACPEMIETLGNIIS